MTVWIENILTRHLDDAGTAGSASHDVSDILTRHLDDAGTAGSASHDVSDILTRHLDDAGTAGSASHDVGADDLRVHEAVEVYRRVVIIIYSRACAINHTRHLTFLYGLHGYPSTTALGLVRDDLVSNGAYICQNY